MTRCSRCNFEFDPAGPTQGLCPKCVLAEAIQEEAPKTEVPAGLAADDLDLAQIQAELPGFEIERRISHTAMSTVWCARERVLDRKVAVKLLRNVSHDPSFVERFTREARVLARMRHPNVVVIHSFGRTRSDNCYLVMELIDGRSLAEVLRQRPMDVHEALAIIEQICNALIDTHREGFVHRDIKPGNILIDRQGQVKVVDFGLSRVPRDRDAATLSLTQIGYSLGTPQYMAPEQASGQGREDHRADIFSVGVMLYEMLTGDLPRGVFVPPSRKVNCGKQLDRIVMRALNEDPELRQQTMAEFRDELQAVREKIDPALIAHRKAFYRQNRWRKRFEMALALAVAVLLGMMIAWYSKPWLERMFAAPGPAAAAHSSPSSGEAL